jgi:hypothetical protein
MTQQKFALCGVELDASNDSGEHLIPNSIGGRRKVFGVFCVWCNNKTRTLWDAEVARQLQFLPLKLGVVRDRDETQTGEFATVTGTPVRIRADGRLSFPPSKPVAVEEGEASESSFEHALGPKRQELFVDSNGNIPSWISMQRSQTSLRMKHTWPNPLSDRVRSADPRQDVLS